MAVSVPVPVPVSVPVLAGQLQVFTRCRDNSERGFATFWKRIPRNAKPD